RGLCLHALASGPVSTGPELGTLTPKIDGRLIPARCRLSYTLQLCTLRRDVPSGKCPPVLLFNPPTTLSQVSAMLNTRRLSQWSPLVTLLILSIPIHTHAQGTKDDYDRSMNFQRNVRGKVYRDRVSPNWIDGGKQLWYEIKTGPDSREWVFVDA